MQPPLILHIDDESDIREVVAEALEKAGMAVRAAGEITEGIRLALERKPDLILLDLHMEKGDGFEACIALRALPELAEVPIVMLTGMRDPEHVAKARSCGVTDYVMKPFEMAVLVLKIKKYLKRR